MDKIEVQIKQILSERAGLLVRKDGSAYTSRLMQCYSSSLIFTGSVRYPVRTRKHLANIDAKYQTMKSLKAFVPIACALTLFSCKKDLNGSGRIITQQRQAGNFTAVSSKGDFKIVLKKGTTPALELTGEDNVLESTITDISNGMLTVKYQDGIKTHKNKQVTVNVTVPAITSVQLEGSGTILSQDSWSIASLSAKINGSGSIELLADGTEFYGEINGSGKLIINGGNYNSSTIWVNGSGNVHALPFTTNTADVKIDGSGTCEMKINNKLKARISGSGKVYYKGSPDTNVTISGSGKVQKL